MLISHQIVEGSELLVPADEKIVELVDSFIQSVQPSASIFERIPVTGDVVEALAKTIDTVGEVSPPRNG